VPQPDWFKRLVQRAANPYVFPPVDGLPKLEVLVTADPHLMSAFIDEWWQGCTTFGLDLEYPPVFNRKATPSATALLQIASGPNVLLFDLVEYKRRSASNRLPAPLEDFLQDPKRTFYGMGLTDDLVRLACEFNILSRGIDFAITEKSWPALTAQLGGGLAMVSNRVLNLNTKANKHVTLSNWGERPLSPEQVQYAAIDAYLSWALAEHFLKMEPAREEWLIDQETLTLRGAALIRRGFRCPAAAFAYE